MDAHLFRRFSHSLEPLLKGARLEKIQEFAPDHLSVSFFGAGERRNLFFRFGRKEPFCFTGQERMEGLPKPSAAIMRLRKYFSGHRIAAVVMQVWSRKIWLMAAGTSESEKTVWLCLDLVKGPSLHFLKPEEIPEPEEVEWPDIDALPAALSDFQNWPVLTPALRRNLQELPLPEQKALFLDLEDGNGDIFLYQDAKGRVRKISAWPLDNTGLQEKAEGDVLAAFQKAGQDIVLEALHEHKNRQMQAPGKKRVKQINRLLEKLNHEEERLSRMAALEDNAKTLAANLWQLDKTLKTDGIVLDGKKIALQSRFTIAENMERMFHEASRGKRGLAMLEERRLNLKQELESLETARPVETDSRKTDQPVVPQPVRNLPRHTQAFLSSDGYVILRGKDAKGNLAIRRLASGHDLWAHVEQGVGAHVIIRRPHGAHEVPERTLIEAGTLAANKSWLAEASSGSVMYAEVRHVKPCRSGPAGKVTIDKIRETRIVPVDHNLESRLAPG